MGRRATLRRAATSTLLFAALTGAPALLLADTVRLKTGKTFEGELVDPGPAGQVRIRLPSGSIVGFPPEQVDSVERGPGPVEQFDRRLERVRSGELEPLVRLLVVARERRLRGRDEKVARRILAIDPNHELARWTLGWVVFENRWVRETELRRREDLVEVGGEWMTVAERDRRRRAQARDEVRQLLAMLESDNERIRAYAASELGGRLRRRDPATVDALVEKLPVADKATRKLALTLLATVSLKSAAEAKRLGSKRVVRELQRLALRETDGAVQALVERNVRQFWPRDSFVLAVDAARGETDEKDVARLARLIETAVQKKWMIELCRSVSDGGPRPAVRRALTSILGKDLGYDAGKWRALWGARQGDFRDVP